MSEAPGRGESISQAGERRSARIESLRGLPALIVVFVHVGILTAFVGGAGVDQKTLHGTGSAAVDRLIYQGRVSVFFFFALSGYLIFWPFARSYFRGGEAISVRQYAINRALRVLPLYYTVVTVLFIFQEDHVPHGELLRFLTFTQNFFLFSANQVDPPMWTMLIEVQFYVLLPFAAWGLARASAGRLRPAAMILLAAGAVGLFLRLYLLRLNSNPGSLTGVNIPACFYFFIPGMLLALTRIAWERERPAWVRGHLARADLWMLASIPFWIVAPLSGRDYDFLVAFAAFLIVGAVVLPLTAGPLTRALDWRPLAAIGVASYSLYLWHYPIVRALVDGDLVNGFWAVGAVALPLSIAVGLVSYRVIEAPFLRWRRQWAASSARQEEPGRVAEEVASAEAEPRS